MNYRQWKKNYKKQHGYNPPLEVDKRKQAKLVKRTIKELSERKQTYTDCIIEAAKRITPTLLSTMSSLCKDLSRAFAGISSACGEMAGNYKRAAEAYEKEG